MKLGLHLAAACGLATFLAVSGPAAATTFTYDLTGDTNTAYTDPAWPGYTYIDLADANTGTALSPGYTLNVGDTVQVTIALNNPVTFNALDIFLQETNDNTTWVWYNSTYAFSLGGAAVPEPASDWGHDSATRGGLGLGIGYYTDAGTFTFDKVVVDAAITSMTDGLSGPAVASIDLTQYVPYIGLYNLPVATTPIPGTLLLMSTALGGLGIFARRKRATAV